MKTKALRFIGGLGVLVAAALVAAPAAATCDIAGTDASLREKIIDLMGPPATVSLFAGQLGKRYALASDRGWDDTRDGERSEFLAASALIEAGIAGRAAPYVKKISGLYFYDDAALDIYSNFFSKDDWFNLSVAARRQATQVLDPLTGLRGQCTPTISCDSFGAAQASGVADISWTGDIGTAAVTHSIWDIFKDPDVGIDYFCRAFGDPETHSGPINLARTIVHENWHTTRAPSHVAPTGFCSTGTTGGDARCESQFVPLHGFTRWDELSTVQDRNVGAYQIDQAFLCDLVNEPNDWVTVELQQAIGAHVSARQIQSRFASGGDRLGRSPFQCQSRASLFSAPAGGTCGALACTSDPDCEVGFCSAGCCIFVK